MPSLVDRPAFLVADASPRLRRIVVASSMLPFDSVSAALHSIIPAPVASRSFFTMSAVIAMQLSRIPVIAFSRDYQALYTRTPASDPAGARRASALLNRGGRRRLFRAHLSGGAAAPGALVAFVLFGLFRLGGLTDAAAGHDRIGNARGEEPDGAQRVVVAGDDEVDFVRIAVRVDDADDRNLQLAGLVDGNLFLARVDDEERVGEPRHVANPFEVLLQLLLFLLDLRDFLLGERLVPAVGFHRFEVA